jgi:hypothetical protein
LSDVYHQLPIDILRAIMFLPDGHYIIAAISESALSIAT